MLFISCLFFPHLMHSCFILLWKSLYVSIFGVVSIVSVSICFISIVVVFFWFGVFLFVLCLVKFLYYYYCFVVYTMNDKKQLECKCGHKWGYKGQYLYASCPSCLNKVKVPQ